MFLMILFFLIFFHYQFTLQPGIISWRYYSVLFYSISFDLNLFHLIHSPITSPHVLSVNFNKFVLRGFLFWGSLLLYENTTTAKLAYHNQYFYIEHNFISRKLVLRGFCYTWHEFWKIQYLLQQSKICSTKTTKRVLLITSACSLLCKSRKTCRLWDTEIYYITGTRVLNEWAWTDNLQCVETGADVVVGSFTQCQQCVEVCFQLFLSHHLTTHITITINITVIITTKYQDQFSSAVPLLWPMKHRWNL